MNKRCKKSTCATQVCILWLGLARRRRRRFAVVHLLLVGLPGSKSCQRRILRLLSVRNGRTENVPVGPLRIGLVTLPLIGQNNVQIKRAGDQKPVAVCGKSASILKNVNLRLNSIYGSLFRACIAIILPCNQSV